MILASRPPFRASGRPPGPGVSGVPAGISHDHFPGFWDSWVLGFLGSPSRSQGNSARGSGQGVPGKEFRARSSGGSIPPCRFPMSPPLLESQRGSSVRGSGSAARRANQPRASLHRDLHQGQFAAICCTSFLNRHLRRKNLYKRDSSPTLLIGYRENRRESRSHSTRWIFKLSETCS